MLKKILYVIVVIVIIVILAIMWTDSSNKKLEAPAADQNTPTFTESTQTDTPASLNKELDDMNIDSGIDADLNSVDADIKTL